MDCKDGRVYMMCGPQSDETCSGVVETSGGLDFCREGCYCPKGMALESGKCIPRFQCPCTWHKKKYHSGESVPTDCNTWYFTLLLDENHGYALLSAFIVLG